MPSLPRRAWILPTAPSTPPDLTADAWSPLAASPRSHASGSPSLPTPSLRIADLTAADVVRVPVSRHAHGWRLPDGSIFLAEFRPKSTILSVPDFGFTTEREGSEGGRQAVCTTIFARRAGTLVATAPVPDQDDAAAGAARLVSDLQAAFGPAALACRQDLEAFVQALLGHSLPDYGPAAAGAFLMIPTAFSKPGQLQHPSLQMITARGAILIPGRLLLPLAGTARRIDNGQAKPLGKIFVQPPTSAHLRAEAAARLEAAKARTKLSLRAWIANQRLP